MYLQVLSGDTQAAEMLAAEVHRDLTLQEVDADDDLPQLSLPLEKCGMWIDPIGMTHILISLSILYCFSYETICLSNQSSHKLLPVNCEATCFA